MTPQPNRRGRLVAIFTGAVSILIGMLYLALMVVLDNRGPLQPPPPEALGLSAVAPAAAVTPSVQRDAASASAPGAAAAGAPVAATVPPPG
ncbi:MULTISPECIES: hypothetical protein [Aphanothece]|uniref:hypothetical protein n=1 Tax=Aphanothece TaxID=1121 RepID=UPI00398EF5B3